MGDGVYKLHETTAFCVERDICTVMEVTVDRGDINNLHDFR